MYYGCAFVGIISFTLWFIFYTDTPENSRFVSQHEYAILSKDKVKELKKIESVPYLVSRKDASNLHFQG